MRVLAMIVGLVGVVLAFVVNLLYSSLHVLSRVAGITYSPSHFFFGLLVILIGLIGSGVALFAPIVGAVLLAGAGPPFFFFLGWGALFSSPLLLLAALLPFSPPPPPPHPTHPAHTTT